MVSMVDVNSDGLPDMVLHFDTQALQLTPSSTEAVLTGKTYDDGTTFMGKDTVSIMSKGKH